MAAGKSVDSLARTAGLLRQAVVRAVSSAIRGRSMLPSRKFVSQFRCGSQIFTSHQWPCESACVNQSTEIWRVASTFSNQNKSTLHTVESNGFKLTRCKTFSLCKTVPCERHFHRRHRRNLQAPNGNRWSSLQRLVDSSYKPARVTTCVSHVACSAGCAVHSLHYPARNSREQQK